MSFKAVVDFDSFLADSIILQRLPTDLLLWTSHFTFVLYLGRMWIFGFHTSQRSS